MDRRILLAGFGGTALALALLLPLDDERRPARPTTAHIGQERHYACELTTRATLPSGDRVIDLRMTGRLALTMLEATPDVVVRAQYTGASLALGGSAAGTTEASERAVQQSLMQPFYLVYRADGTLVRVKTNTETNAFVAGLFRALGNSVRIAAPSTHSATWDTTEHDGTDAYAMQYRVLAGSALAPRRIGAHKLHYVDAHNEVLASETTLDFDAARMLNQLRSHETLRAVGGPLPDLEVTTAMTLVLIDAAQRRDDVAMWLEEHRALPDSVPEQTSQETLDRAAISGWQYADMLAVLRAHALAKQTGSPSNSAKQRAARAYAALTAFLRLHPEHLVTVRAQILAESPLANTLVAALRDAGSAEAQSVLRDLLVESAVADKRPRIARALSLVAEPTEATIAALREMQDDPLLGVQASYGLGSALHRLRDRDPDLAATVLRHLLEQLAVAQTTSRVIELLNALGNAGHPDTLQVLAPYMGHGDEQIRAAATRALRRIPDAAADALLSTATRDQTTSVRAAAVEAITRRMPTNLLAAALVSRLLDESEFAIRAQAVHTAASWLPHMSAALANPLAHVAARDASEDLRRIARAALP